MVDSSGNNRDRGKDSRKKDVNSWSGLWFF